MGGVDQLKPDSKDQNWDDVIAIFSLMGVYQCNSYELYWFMILTFDMPGVRNLMFILTDYMIALWHISTSGYIVDTIKFVVFRK